MGDPPLTVLPALTIIGEASSRRDTELCLARLAARLVRERGPIAAQQEFARAITRAELALRRIASLSRGEALPPEHEVARPATRRPSPRQVSALAAEFECLDGAAQNAQPPAISLRDAGGEATQLFMLLALAAQVGTDIGADGALFTGHRLLAALVPEHPLQRRFLCPVGPEQRVRTDSGLRRYPLALVFYSMAIVAYLLLRFRGHYVEQDTAAMSQFIEAVAAYGSALPAPGVHPVYPFGFGFQAVNIYLMRLSGASIQTLQAWVWPFLLVGLALVAFQAFREITGDDRVAALAGLLLFMQPDFLFTALRGSHEKMTYCMVLVALLLLFRSYRYRHRLWVFTSYVFVYYVVLFGIACTNSTFGSSLVVALTVSFFGGALISRMLEREGGVGDRAFIRLAYVSFSSFLILCAQLFYVYAPSSGILDQFLTALDRLAGLASNFRAGENPFADVPLSWLSTRIYVVLTTFTWLTLAISGIAWGRTTGRFLRGGWLTAPDHLRLRWLLYAGLALQVGLAMVIDFAGVLGANLELRLFPVFIFIAIPTGSAAVVGFLDSAAGRPRLRRGMRVGVTAATVAFTVFSVLKATNEPLLSNKWTFYSESEAQAMDWLAVALPQGSVWTDVDERLREVYMFRSRPTEDAAIRYPTLLRPDQVSVIMLSQITRDRMARLGMPLPDVSTLNELYDNGPVQIYRHLPQSPLQR
ncbi:MAG: hypothetical protein ACR2JY_11785 [Chloroflexota bacterium]